MRTQKSVSSPVTQVICTDDAVEAKCQQNKDSSWNVAQQMVDYIHVRTHTKTNTD